MSTRVDTLGRIGVVAMLLALPPLTLSSAQAAEPRTPLVGAAAAEGGDPAAAEAVPAPADPKPADQEPAASSDDLEELRRRIDVLAAEVDQLRSGEREAIAPLDDSRRRELGVAPSAAATYSRARGVSIAGYGEMLYEARDGADESGRRLSPSRQLDMLRVILYTGYRFSDRWVFNSEIELEHADEISVEFAYLDYLAAPNLTVRAGMVLVPLGLVNEFHEPNVFLGARRPETESRIIPSTWRENGAGILGSAGVVQYRAFVVNGLNAAGFSSSGIRGGRQKGAKARAVDLAFAGRLDVAPMPGVFFGTGLYTGGSGQGQFPEAGAPRVATTIAEAHGQVQIRGVDVRGLFARAVIGDAAALTDALGRTAPVADDMAGGYLQVGYDVLSQVSDRMGLTPFYRYERLNTQQSVPAPFLPDLAQDGVIHTVGVELRPIYNVVIKADLQRITNQARTGRSQFNIGLGYAF